MSRNLVIYVVWASTHSTMQLTAAQAEDLMSIINLTQYVQDKL